MATANKSVKATVKAQPRTKVIRTQTTASRKEIVLVVPPVKVPTFLEGFIEFVRTQGVVGLAVGLVLGVAAKSVVDSLVTNVFNPIIGLVGGGSGSLDGRFVCLKHTVTTAGGQQVVSCSNKLGYGSVLSQVISFLIVAAVVYFVVRGLKLDKLDKPKAK